MGTLTVEQAKGQHTIGGVPTVLVKGVKSGQKPHFVNEHEYDEKKHGEKIDVESQPTILVSGLPRQQYVDGKPVVNEKTKEPVMTPAEPVRIMEIMYDESVHGEILEEATAPKASTKSKKAAKE